MNNSQFDEARLIDGTVKPEWRYLLDSINSLGTEEIQQRQFKVAKILRDDGATYNSAVGGTHLSAQSQRWGLDLLPLLISSEEWSEVEIALQERAELFNLIFKDLYGKRELISRGILPPELIFGHANFLRACDQLQLASTQQLLIHGVDLVRDADGELHVCSDRLQSPSGLGYALENRMVMSRVLPSVMRESMAHRLTGFFQLLRQKLVSLVPDVAAPRIVVLTPGPYSETFYEHAFLANYLGFSLVQSGDLLVRGGFLWMRTLNGLIKVDVVLRRVDEWYCDPVELKGDSQLGVPGLLQVARAGNVAIANPLGSGVLENPALYAYLEKISDHFFGRPLKLKSVQSWWCGEPGNLQYVLGEFSNLVIKEVARGLGLSTTVVSELNEQQTQSLVSEIKARPKDFVAQAKLTPSQAPTFKGNQLVNRPIIFRGFCVAAEDASYHVLPGGLTRVGQQTNSAVITNRVGATSKDTWVIASEPEKQAILTTKIDPKMAYTEGAALPSRVVENLFWLGRYMERAETNLRYIRTLFIQFNSQQTISRECRYTLLRGATQLTSTYPGFVENAALCNQPEPELLSLIVEAERVGSVAHGIKALLSCADQLPGVLSSDSQRVINDIADEMESLNTDFNHQFLSAPEESLDPLISSLLALSGIVHESMLRDTGWLFVELGRRIERALQSCSLLRSLLFAQAESLEENVLLESVATTLESLISYRRRYGGTLTAENMLELIMLDSNNPRSIDFQINNIVSAIYALPREQRTSQLSEQLRSAREAQSKVQLGQVNLLASASGEGDTRAELDMLCAQVHAHISQVSEALSGEYFVHQQDAQQLIKFAENNAQ